MNRTHAAALLTLLMLGGHGTGLLAAEVPSPSESDARVRYVPYVKDQVTVVNVRRGSVTRLVLGDDEKIQVAATGFASDCKKAEDEWCVVADTGTNQVWAKPKDGATFNNLELRTDKRDYSVEFRVLPDVQLPCESEPIVKAVKAKPNEVGCGKKALSSEPMFRVIFSFPAESPAPALIAAQFAAEKQNQEKRLLASRLNAASSPQARNYQYSMQVMPGGEYIAPAEAFDDGRFTFFQFPGNQPVPAIFYVTPSGEEVRAPVHMQGTYRVVQRVAERFVLRLGDAVVGVWNDAYDPTGVPPVGDTTVPGVERTIK